jgi:hypothetical protein
MYVVQSCCRSWLDAPKNMGYDRDSISILPATNGRLFR